MEVEHYFNMTILIISITIVYYIVCYRRFIIHNYNSVVVVAYSVEFESKVPKPEFKSCYCQFFPGYFSGI